MDKREVDILEHWPPILQQIREFQEIAKVENPYLTWLWNKIEEILDNQFIVTANEEGLSRYENMLSLDVPATDTIETRRFRLLTRYQEQVPYTYKVLIQLLDSLLGEGKYIIERDAADKTLTVKIELTVKGQFDAVEEMLERIVPQNVVLLVELRFNQHYKFESFTHDDLTAYTHKQLREDVIT